MDELVIKYYRKLLRYGFEYSGSLENPEIYLDSVGEKIRVCGHNEYNYLHVYIHVVEQEIKDIKYLCTCDPTANVAVEIFCSLVIGKPLTESEKLTPESFSLALGSSGEEFLQKSAGIIELFNRGLDKFRKGSSLSN